MGDEVIAANPNPLYQTQYPPRTVEVVECDRWRFDEEAADRPCRFIQKFCRHYEGRRWEGKPFLLLPWQRWFVRQCFGWVHRDTGLRRFREVFILSAKGAGKTPLLSAIGLYMLLGDGEPAAHVISQASTFEQANYTFGAAKKFIELDPQLRRHPSIEVKKFEIVAPRFSQWTTVSGKNMGRSGSRPHCLIADEAHEWPNQTAVSFDTLRENLFKRDQSLTVVATNAGADRQCYAWKLYERAIAVAAGKLDVPELLPLIFECPKEVDWRTEDAARWSNPSMPDVVSFESIKSKQIGDGESKYRRRFLSQWVQAAEKWLDVEKVDACTAAFDAASLTKHSLYIGADIGETDDMTAVEYVWTDGLKVHVRHRMWMTRAAAEKHDAAHGMQFVEWAKAGHITLVESPTIGPAEKRAIAATIVDHVKGHNVVACCYDRAKADDLVAAMEAKGITPVPVAQGWTLSPGCREFSRRLEERSIVIEPNPAFRAQCEVVEVIPDNRGNIWPRKPNSTSRNVGNRWQKIDGITALVTALTEARKITFANRAPSPQVWQL